MCSPSCNGLVKQAVKLAGDRKQRCHDDNPESAIEECKPCRRCMHLQTHGRPGWSCCATSRYERYLGGQVLPAPTYLTSPSMNPSSNFCIFLSLDAVCLQELPCRLGRDKHHWFDHLGHECCAMSERCIQVIHIKFLRVHQLNTQTSGVGHLDGKGQRITVLLSSGVPRIWEPSCSLGCDIHVGVPDSLCLSVPSALEVPSVPTSAGAGHSGDS